MLDFDKDPSALILDTCVVSDLYKADQKFFSQIAQSFVKMCVTQEIIKELADEFPGIFDGPTPEIKLPTIDTVLADYIGLIADSRLSETDQIVMRVAKRCGCTLVTNDKKLFEGSKGAGVKVLWGLAMLVALYGDGVIDETYAKQIGASIHRENPRFITKPLYEDFLKKVHSRKLQKQREQ